MNTPQNIYNYVVKSGKEAAFITRHEEQYQIHFLIHRYPDAMKAQFEEEIAQEVVRYMILRTIITLHLNTWKKIDEYIGK